MVSRVRLYMGIFFAAPVSLVTGLFYILPFWLLGWHRYLGVKESTSGKSALGTGLAWVVDEDKAPKWLLKRWVGWGGHCVGSFVVIRTDKKDRQGVALLNHELHHVHQMHTFGFFQPILYVLSMFTAWVAGEKPYLANHFEVAARRTAGQIVDAQSFTQGYMWCKTGHK